MFDKVNDFSLKKNENSKNDGEVTSPKLEEIPFEVALQIIGK
jgi:hypothetical protein